MPRAGGGSHSSSHHSSTSHSSGHRTSSSHHSSSTRSGSSSRPSTTTHRSNSTYSPPKRNSGVGAAPPRQSAPHTPPPQHGGPHVPAPRPPMHHGPGYVAPPPPPINRGPHMAPPPPPPRRRRYIHIWPRRRYYGTSTTVYTNSSTGAGIWAVVVFILVIAMFIGVFSSISKAKRAEREYYDNYAVQEYNYNYSNNDGYDYSYNYDADFESTVPLPTVSGRDKLDAALCKETEYYSNKTDKLGFFSDDVIEGMKYFYDKTGVQPYVMTEKLSKVDKYDDEKLEKLYLDTFDDEGHFLLIIFGDKEGNYDWEYSWVIGNDAEKVIDDETLEIFWWYLDEYYSSDMNDDELISTAFHDAADDIVR